MISTILFDLDGTLLPMDQEVFVNSYFKELSKTMKPYISDSKALVKAVWAGTEKMMANDGKMTNEQCFWNTFCAVFGEDILKLKPKFDSFYENEFNNVKNSVGFNPLARECTEILADKGYTLIAATNPLFPRSATLNRLNWAGVDSKIFSKITTYETSSYCKPNTEYYKEILEDAGINAESCMMVGNDVSEDMCVSKINMDTYLITDCIINSKNTNIENIKQGSFEDFKKFALSLPQIN
ncbi:MAG: HAD family hydrolase [Acutalibacteraceae bacterium]